MTAKFSRVLPARPTVAAAPVTGAMVRRKCACSDSASPGHACQKCDAEEIPAIRRKANRATPGSFDGSAFSKVQGTLAGSGQPLESKVRHRFERAIGQDFSHVRVHTDSPSAESAAAIGASAYTSGSHIVFGRGQFDPDSARGTRLLAHELAHTLQDDGGAFNRAATIDPVDSPQEREADAVADAVMAERRPALISRVGQSNHVLRRAPLTELDCGAFQDAPLEPAQWKKCTHKGLIRKEESNPLRIDENGLIATPEALVDWALKKNFDTTEKDLRRKFGSSELVGTSEARAAAQRAFDSAMRTLPFAERRGIWMEDQAFHASVRYAKELAKAEAELLEAVRLAVEEYYTLGERMRVKGTTLLSIDEAADAEREGRAAGVVTVGKHKFWRGQTMSRFTVVSPAEAIIKINGQCYYSMRMDDFQDLFYGRGRVFEEVFQNTKHINIAYGKVLKAVGWVASLGPNPLGQLMGPALETAGEGMIYDIEAIDARNAGQQMAQPAPEITWKTLAQGLSNVAGNKIGGVTGKFVGKYSPRAGKIAGTAAGIQSSNIIVKGFDYAMGEGDLKDVFLPDLSPVEFLESMVAAHVIHKFSARWNKGKAPKVPAGVDAAAAKSESRLSVEKIAENQKAAATKKPVAGAGAADKKAGAANTGGGSGKALADKFKPVPEGVAPTLDAVRSKWNPKHEVVMSDDGLQWCSPKPCPLLRKMYKRELKENAALARVLDDIEVQRKAYPKDPYWRDQSVRMEAKLAELKATNELLAAIPEKNLKAQAKALATQPMGLDGEQIEVFAKEMKKQSTKAGRQGLINKFFDLGQRSAEARGRGRLSGVDPHVDMDIDVALDKTMAEAKQQQDASKASAAKGKSPGAKGDGPVVNPQDIVAQATSNLKKRGVSGLAPREYGTKLHAEVNNVLRQKHGSVPSGWQVSGNTKMSQIIKLDPKVAKLTVRKYLKQTGLDKQVPKLPDDLLNTKIGELKPDMFARAPDGRVLVWDLTSRIDPVHMSKTMLYGEIVGRETGSSVRLTEEYWAKVTK